MNLAQCLEAIATAHGDGPVDWTAVQTAAKAATTPGSISLSEDERSAYRTDIRDARDQIQTTTGIQFELPATIEIHNRHHWIDANVSTVSRILQPLERNPGVLPSVTRRLNTATLATMLAFLASHVLGQYDPGLLGDTESHSLYFVRPNISRTATVLDVEYHRFRRWIIYHEVTHAAEFAAAPWLVPHLESNLRAVLDKLATREIDREVFLEIDSTMTVVEGYAEFTMDRAFDDHYQDLRAKIDAYRRSHGPLTNVIRRVLGLGLKRRQYERGRTFFETVVETHGQDIATRVWDDPQSLPTPSELDDPARWVSRITA